MNVTKRTAGISYDKSLFEMQELVLNTPPDLKNHERIRAVNRMTPFLIKKTAKFDNALLNRMSELNQILLHAEYLQNKLFNSEHNGLSLYLTTTIAGGQCNDKSCSVELNNNIIEVDHASEIKYGKVPSKKKLLQVKLRFK